MGGLNVLADTEVASGEVGAGAQRRGSVGELGQEHQIGRSVERVADLELGVDLAPTQPDVERFLDGAVPPLLDRRSTVGTGARGQGRGAR